MSETLKTVSMAEQIWPMVDGAVLGGMGGLVNHLRKKTARDWGQLCVSILTAAFAGMLAQLVAGWLNADVRLQFAISGMAGYSGGTLLDDVVTRFRKIVNNGLDTASDLAGQMKKGKAEK